MLRYHAIYIPPSSSLEPSSEREQAPITPPPSSILSDRMIERILTEGCFVENIPDRAHDFKAVIVDESPSHDRQDLDESRFMASLKQLYAGSSSATDLRYNLPLPTASSKRAYATFVVPGWVRARVTEILFVGDEADEAESLPDAILRCLLKLPIDLRVPLATSILVTGGTASLPGFASRLRASLLRLISAPPIAAADATAPISPQAARLTETTAFRRRHKEPYKALYGLADKLAILNDPAPLDGDGSSAGGKAPKWTPGLLSWVGGSLAGALKTGGPELLREEYDALCADALARADANRTLLDEAEAEIAALVGLDLDELLPGMALDGLSAKRKRGYHEGPILADWTRGGVTAGLR
ncbi:MAG: hypothetical protein TREMPRED_005228 [Tremellales sp. Tagirdzhanova-0007]|nr:MAG: hypothetical protein TREMPRED_005228 [Tremellales sp. Tagirdzhanova-0007]